MLQIACPGMPHEIATLMQSTTDSMHVWRNSGNSRNPFLESRPKNENSCTCICFKIDVYTLMVKPTQHMPSSLSYSVRKRNTSGISTATSTFKLGLDTVCKRYDPTRFTDAGVRNRILTGSFAKLGNGIRMPLNVLLLIYMNGM